MFGFFFTEQETVTCYEDVARCDVEKFKRFSHLMLQNGVYIAPLPLKQALPHWRTVQRD